MSDPRKPPPEDPTTQTGSPEAVLEEALHAAIQVTALNSGIPLTPEDLAKISSSKT